LGGDKDEIIMLKKKEMNGEEGTALDENGEPPLLEDIGI
jgi:hypothetical protein